MNRTLTGSTKQVEFDPGYRIRAAGWKGKVSMQAPQGAGVRTRSTLFGLPAGLDRLDEALALTDTHLARQIELDVAPASSGPAALATRGAEGSDTIELEVPDAGPEYGQVVMSVDEAGAVRWHLPVTRPAAPDTASRGTGSGIIFRIPAYAAARSAPDATGATRSVLGAIGRRILKVLVYPITDPILGTIAEFIAGRWEASKRPYRLRHFTPTNYANADAPTVTAEELESMAKAGPILLFVHGTFSTAHGGFGGMPLATVQELHRRYGERVLAFDHPTLSVDPFHNAKWLIGQLPGTPVTVDIVCHSRGGLVSRTLAELPAAAALNGSHLTVRKLVLGATPNNGTPLADAEHMVAMIDRLTTALTLLPGGAVTETLEALVTVIKALGHAGLKGLDGLASMQPSGTFLGSLNVAGQPSTSYYAIAANYTPTDRGLRALVMGAADSVVDHVFEGAENDLVVPTEGVYGGNGHARFPVSAQQRLVLGAQEGVMHTNLFGHRDVSTQLLAWLS